MKYRVFFVIMFFAILIGSIAHLATPILIQYWSNDNFFLDQTRIITIFLILLSVIVIEILIIFLREKFAETFNIHNCKRLLGKYINLSYDVINEKGPTYLVDRISIIVNTYYGFFTGDNVGMWTNFIVVGALIFIVMLNNVFLAILLLALIPINYFGYKLINKKLLEYSKKLQDNTSAGWRQILSIAQNPEYIKQVGQQELLLRHFEPSIKLIYKTMAEVNIFAQTSSQALSSINTVSNIMIITFVIYDFISRGANPLSIILYTIALPLYFSNLSAITRANLNKRDMLASREFDNMLSDNQESLEGQFISTIDTVTFNLPELKIGDQILASKIVGDFQKGDIVWVTGKSGSGKSTLLKLLPKFRGTQDISINGHPLSCVSTTSIRNQIEYMSQNVPIIHGSLRDNLFLGKNYSKEIENSMRSEPILLSILSTKDMDSTIMEDGANLSGGEKQKIAFVRAFYNSASVLILDEIASNIDKESSEEIYARILESCTDKIVFIVSHDKLSDTFYNKILDLNEN